MTQPHTHNTARRSSIAMTLVELLLALALMGIMGIAVTATLFAASAGTTSRNDMRAVLIKHKTLSGRINSAIHQSNMVLATGSNFVVLWNQDSNGDGMPNLNELQRLEFNTSTSQVWSYTCVFPTSWTPSQLAAANTQYALTADFDAATTSLKSQSYCVSTLWANNVTAWSTSTDSSGSVQAATMLSYRVSVSNGTLPDTIIGNAALYTSGRLSGH